MKSMDSKSIGFIGAGIMAEAIIRGLIDRGVFSPSRIRIYDPAKERCDFFSSTFGVIADASNEQVIEKSDIIILAVKPQVMASALAPAASTFRANQLVISIAAGIRTETLDTICGKIPAIIRIMPNTPALIGQGISAICPGPRATEAHLEMTETIFSAVGSTIRVDESAMDGVTAISGSGPAYIFYWMENMLKAAGELGFEPSIARKLVYQTFIGSSALAAASQEAPEELRKRVTSKGGTTEAAIRTMNEAGVDRAVIAAVQAASRRSKELSQS